MSNKISLLKNAFKRELNVLKNFDFNSLDFNEAGQWPVIVKSIVVVFVFVLILFVGNKLHLSSLQDVIVSENSKEESLLQDVASYSYVNPTIKDYEEQLIILKNNLEKIKQQLPEKIEMSSILDDMTQLASESNVVVISINLNNEVDTENYVELPFIIKTKGKFHNFAAFISELARMNRIVTIHDVNIIPSKDNSLLQMEFIAKTYKYKEKVIKEVGE